MKVEQVDHIHIAVKDMNKAVSFFSDLLGIKFSKEFVSEEMKIISRLASIGPIGIELIQPTSPDSEIAKFIERRGEGVQAISLKVPDIDEAVTEAEAKGVRAVFKVNFPMLREVEMHPRDAHGVQIELCQYETYHPGAFALFEKSIT